MIGCRKACNSRALGAEDRDLPRAYSGIASATGIVGYAVMGACPSQKARCCTYSRWFARPLGKHARSLLDIPVSAACMKGLLRFRMGCHRLPRDEGSWARPNVPRLQRVCRLCTASTLGDEKHLVFECPELRCFREQWPHLSEGPQTMLAFMWQDDLIGVAKFVNACLQKMNRSEGQTSDQPGVAGRDVM